MYKKQLICLQEFSGHVQKKMFDTSSGVIFKLSQGKF